MNFDTAKTQLGHNGGTGSGIMEEEEEEDVFGCEPRPMTQMAASHGPTSQGPLVATT